MKYKLTANDTVMCENVSALVTLNTLMNMLKANTDTLDIKLYYKSASEYKLENTLKVKD